MKNAYKPGTWHKLGGRLWLVAGDALSPDVIVFLHFVVPGCYITVPMSLALLNNEFNVVDDAMRSAYAGCRPQIEAANAANRN